MNCLAACWLSLAVLVVGAGCYSAPLTEGGRAVQLMKGDPPATCQDVGSVSGRGDDEEMKVGLRNHAARKGANYVRMETYSAITETTTGTAFRCARPSGSE
jgi:hypothetical protein